MKEEINSALEVLKNGGLILYPTDTIWGIGCDATNPQAVAKIFALKGRDQNKSLIILLDADSKIESYVRHVPDVAYDLIEFAENPLTIIFSGAKNLAPEVINEEDGSVGIRVVKHPFCQQLIQRFRKPIVSTSANLSGRASPASFSQIDQKIINGVDYVVDLEQDDTAPKKPSTIMKIEPDGLFKFIRR